MKLIVGLGNPGKKYEKTRHNIGFLILDNYLNEKNIILDKEKFNGKYTKIKNGNEIIIFAKPMTYMNRSGHFLSNLMSYYGVGVHDIFVIVDDKDQLFGKLKIKKDSSSGGQNGIKNIIELLGSKEFLRLKIGVGKKDSKLKTSDFVLSSFSKEELKFIENKKFLFNNIIDEFILGKNLKELENKYNGEIK